MSLEPRLPPELEMRIFELAAEALSHPRRILPLLQVARRTLIWIEPLLYRVVSWDVAYAQKQTSAASAALRALRSKPAHFVHTAVRHVIIYAVDNSGLSTQDMDEVLGRCTGGISFVSSSRYVTPRLLPIFARIQVQRLSISLQHLFEGSAVDLAHPMFSSVTHLFPFGDMTPSPEHPFYLQLPVLPKLTHLCLGSGFPPAASPVILANCRSLCVAVTLWSPRRRKAAQNFTHDSPVPDPRFVVLDVKDDWGSWERYAYGEIDFWTRAEEFLARKANGEIEVSCFWLE
ncbi:hypothetical protein C8J57DRAFT_1278035 [Mycena rebaudengoi]|nr:hypothetical protein C8J57DRAFT_1278035 [Mycena rebaudengoi]